jgi:NAD(P)-dependent dehydrogenase (short-subunit alcohol dehydrogenase family)
MRIKTALVTGGTSGIGLSLVKALAKESYRIFFIGTNKYKGREIETQLKKQYSNLSINFVHLDLSDLREVHRFANEFKSENKELDLLANIAGVLLLQRSESKDGIEKTFAISYLASFHMTNQLIPLLKKSQQGRVINVAAAPSVILKPELDFDNLNSQKKYNGFQASTLAVHAKTVFTQSLAEKLADSNITVNSFHPGNIRSELFRNMAPIQRNLMKLFTTFFKTESSTAIYTALNPKLNTKTGNLIVGTKAIPLNFNRDYKDRLWDKSKEMVNLSLQ